MKRLSIRLYAGLGFILSLFMLGFAIYLEKIYHLLPCSLCQLERITVGIIAFCGLIVFLWPRKMNTQLFSYLIVFFSFIGVLLAGRQLYLQYFPHLADTNCVPGLAYLFNTFPINEAIKIAITGTGDCAKITWQFLGLSLSGWTLGGFLILGCLAVLQNKAARA